MINYYLLTKPGIIFGNLITMAAGFLLASRGVFHPTLFLAVVLGLAFVIASACVFNNIIDRATDRKMKRTRSRALAAGAMRSSNALIFATLLAIAGNAILFLYTNTLTILLANAGFGIYVLLYSFWKTQTIYATAIGSLAGAIPPVAGYCAVSNRFDKGALILFALMVLWQMPHFYAIAITHLSDYKAAGIPLLPVKKGLLKTKVHMTLYILAFIIVVALLTFFDFAGYIYLTTTVGASLIWFLFCLRGFNTDHEGLWAKNMFRLSLLVIMVVCSMLYLDINTGAVS